MSGMLENIREHFWHMAPILVAGGVAFAIAAERFFALVVRFPMHGFNGFFEKIGDYVMSDRLAEAIALCDRYQHKPAAAITKEALLRAHQPEELIEQGLEYTVTDNIERIMRRTSFLSTIANVSTLLGLFGTIAGLIQSFEAVGGANPQQRSAMLAAGISTAMNATMMGLAVAIPCMVVFSYLMNRSNRLTTEAEKAGIRVLDILKQRAYAVENEGIRGGGGQGNRAASSGSPGFPGRGAAGRTPVRKTG